MKSVLILLLLALYTAARGVEAGGCGRAGALRCDDDGRHLSACTSGGAWRQVDDCAASNAVCVEGRCVPHLRTNAAREGECSTPGEAGCADCATPAVCSINGNWIPTGKCGVNEECEQGECIPGVGCTNPVRCSLDAVGHTFPNIRDCTHYFNCTKQWEEPQTISCGTRGNYDPCLEDCRNDAPCLKYTSCTDRNAGQYFSVTGNPYQYYLCLNDQKSLLDMCSGIFYPAMESCLPFDECVVDEVDDVAGGNGGTNPTPTQCTPKDKWANPDNECQYYLCNSSGNYVEQTCPPNTKFNEATKECIISIGSCK